MEKKYYKGVEVDHILRTPEDVLHHSYGVETHAHAHAVPAESVPAESAPEESAPEAPEAPEAEPSIEVTEEPPVSLSGAWSAHDKLAHECFEKTYYTGDKTNPV